MKQRHKWYHHLFGLVLFLLLFSAALAIGYGLSILLFQITGRPGLFASYLISAIFGILVLVLIIKLAVSIHYSSYDWSGSSHGNMMSETIDALNRISQGDFSVFLSVDKRDNFSQLADTVNKMARQLGSMEHLRQDFISNVSHEIQSPLTSISGFAALLKNEKITAEQRSHYLEVIETESSRLSKLSDNLLKLSSLESGAHPLAVTKFRLDQQIQNAALMLEPQWVEKNIELSLSLDKIICSGDENLLIQCWINLLHNAIKFTPAGGEIEVVLTAGEGGITCRISDNGAGIAEMDMLHIFERFYKADKARDRALGGNGLGLSLVKKIVDLHGGTVSLESEVGKGTTFIVTLPN